MTKNFYGPDEYPKYSFCPYVLIRFLVFFLMLNKSPNALNAHLYD